MVKVQFLNPTDGGEPREIDVKIQDKETSMLVIKQQIYAATGIKIKDQKIMLAGIGSLALFDKRDMSLGYSHCGSSNSLAFCLDKEETESK